MISLVLTRDSTGNDLTGRYRQLNNTVPTAGWGYANNSSIMQARLFRDGYSATTHTGYSTAIVRLYYGYSTAIVRLYTQG